MTYANADLRGVDLSGADLRGADLTGADLTGVDLSEANLSDADLSGANLLGANLLGAYLRIANLAGADLTVAGLCGANLRGANLAGANLAGVDLGGADLDGADLTGANLHGAYLRSAYLTGADLTGATLPDTISHPPDTGAWIAWKTVADGVVLKCIVPATAARTGALVGRKCRAEYAIPTEAYLPNGDIVTEGEFRNACIGGASAMTYVLGAVAYPDSYDPDIRVECTHGIHLWMTDSEAS